MDVRNYTWVNTFDNAIESTKTSTTDPTSEPTTVSANKSNDNKLVIITGTLGGILGAAVLTTVGYFGYKRFKKRKEEQSEIIKIPGSRSGGAN